MDSTELRATVAENIRTLAEAKGVTLNSLADFAGVSRAQLYAVLAEKTAPTTDWLSKIAAVLEVEPSRLLAAPSPSRQKGR
ncbi:MAG TPA: helix-turn-helix transcriptional regulator [Polyangiaceae bacterium]